MAVLAVLPVATGVAMLIRPAGGARLTDVEPGFREAPATVSAAFSAIASFIAVSVPVGVSVA